MQENIAAWPIYLHLWKERERPLASQWTLEAKIEEHLEFFKRLCQYLYRRDHYTVTAGLGLMRQSQGKGVGMLGGFLTQNVVKLLNLIAS